MVCGGEREDNLSLFWNYESGVAVGEIVLLGVSREEPGLRPKSESEELVPRLMNA